MWRATENLKKWVHVRAVHNFGTYLSVDKVATIGFHYFFELSEVERHFFLQDRSLLECLAVGQGIVVPSTDLWKMKLLFNVYLRMCSNRRSVGWALKPSVRIMTKIRSSLVSPASLCQQVQGKVYISYLRKRQKTNIFVSIQHSFLPNCSSFCFQEGS